jgi:hypothetical protein
VFALEAVFITWLVVELFLVGRERRRPARPVAGGRLLTHGASVRLGVALLAVLVVMASLIVVVGTARGDVLEAVFGGRISARLIGAGELAIELQRHVPRSRIEPPAWEQLTWLVKALQET